MNIISDDIMWDFLYDILSNYKKEDPIASKLVKLSCDYLTNTYNGEISTEDICDSVLACFDYYNDYIKEKNMQLKQITKSEYDMTVLMLNAAIGLILEERQ